MTKQSNMNAYERLKKDEKSFLSTDTIPEIDSTDYMQNLANSYFPGYLKVLPPQFETTVSGGPTRRSILDTIRINNPNINDLGLPDVNAHKTDLTLYDSTNNNTVQSNKNAFANPLIVPTNDTKKINKHENTTWNLKKLILGHTGHVTSVAIDPFNAYFTTGSADRTIKIWNLVSGELQLTLSGHIMAVRGMVISPRHPYLFSASEDKTVKCWDLEKNVVVRDYHGHLSAVYTIDLHPELDLIVTAGRDSSVRVWDVRTRTPIHVLTGHQGSVNKVVCRDTDPQIISCSMDSTVKTWDLRAGKCDKTLTFHSKSVRAFTTKDDELVTASSDGLKKFDLNGYKYKQDMEFWNDHDSVSEGNLIVNTVCSSEDGVIFGGCDNGKFGFWDWESGKMIKNDSQIPVPGSLDSETGILCSTFDKSGERLITGNIDKSVRIWNMEKL